RATSGTPVFWVRTWQPPAFMHRCSRSLPLACNTPPKLMLRLLSSYRPSRGKPCRSISVQKEQLRRFCRVMGGDCEKGNSFRVYFDSARFDERGASSGGRRGSCGKLLLLGDLCPLAARKTSNVADDPWRHFFMESQQ